MEEVKQEEATVVDTDAGIQFARLLAFRGRFDIEINTGMKSRVNTLKAYNEIYGTKFRTRVQAREDCLRQIKVAQDQASERARKAMEDLGTTEAEAIPPLASAEEIRGLDG